MANGIQSHRNNLMSWKILIKSTIAEIIMMLVLINMVLNVKYCYHFGKMKDGFILLILMVVFSGIFRYWEGRRFVDGKRQINRWKKNYN